jgi:choline dehydrogenase
VTTASEYDYVIVGAGSSGCAVAWQLSARTEGTICVLEAGGSDDAAAIHDPGSCYTLAAGEHDWGYRTIPQQHTGYRAHTWPSGRVIGGSSSINGMAYLRGCPEDYESWSYHGADGWDAKRVFAAFAEIEAAPDATSGAAGGMLRLSMPEDLTEVAHEFLSASGRLGFSRNDRLYLGELHGAGRPAWTIHGGQRQSAARAFLQPAVASGRVTVQPGSEAARIICEAGRAVGVEYSGTECVRARRQVIVSCGAVGSAALLLRSGIGPYRQLDDVGIPVIADLPGVGRGLHDHVMASVVFEVDGTSGEPPPVLCQACLFVPSAAGGSAPEIQLSLVEGTIFADGPAIRAGRRYFTIIA